MRLSLKLFILSLLMLAISSCEKFALMSTPKKTAKHSSNHLATAAETRFWESLHEGRYDQIPEVTRLLTAAYLQNPNDPELAAHLGFIHIWKLTEREREKILANDPRIVNEIILAKKYFSDATLLNPHDARYQGFLGDSILIEGKIFQDEREQVRGYFLLKQAIQQWPEFNYFTAGYPMSTLNRDDKSFKEALEWQWKTLDLCAGEKMDRNNPDFTAYLSRETQTGPLRACWNSWIAPHNFEGFFLNMGDMLVKQGDWRTAIKIYNNAKLSKTYANWPYKALLENHLKEAKNNVSIFQESKLFTYRDKALLFDSGYGCVACHQEKTRTH